MNGQTWYHHPVVITRTLVLSLLLSTVLVTGATLFDQPQLLFGLIPAILIFITHYQWLRRTTFSLSDSYRLSISVPYELHRTTFNIFNSTIEYDQRIIGKILNTGSAIFHVENKTYKVKWIARFREFKTALEECPWGRSQQTGQQPVNVYFVTMDRQGRYQTVHRSAVTPHDYLTLDSNWEDGDNAYRQ